MKSWGKLYVPSISAAYAYLKFIRSQLISFCAQVFSERRCRPPLITLSRYYLSVDRNPLSANSSPHLSPFNSLDKTLSMTIKERPLVTISLADYENRLPELVKQLTSVAEESGFFALTDHGITEEEIKAMFTMSERFFSLPDSVKVKYPFERAKVPEFPLPRISPLTIAGGRLTGQNAGWESNSQLRPSTGTYDMKESMQLQYNSAAATGKWPSRDDCPDFESTTKGFMAKCNKVSYDVMRLFAMSLGMEDTE
jgi:non-haem dioxygenase in morphine synthesis N-terminal